MFGRRNAAAPDNRQVCTFWKAGKCRFGKDCRYKHEDTGPNTGFLNSNPPAGNQRRSNSRRRNAYALDRDAIKADLTEGEEKPGWPLSCYGPGRDAPQQLIAGPEYEQSPEEMRVLCYLARANGHFEQYELEQTQRVNKANAEVARILANLDDAIRFVQEGENREGNRLAQVTNPNINFPNSDQGFSRPPQAARPSGLGSFGQPSQLGGNLPFASGLGSQGGFQKAQKPQTAAGAGLSFGQPSAIGASPFARPSGGTFSAPSQPAQPSFGQPSSQQTTSPFAQPQQQQASPFAQPQQQNPSPFAQPQQQNPSPFARPPQQNSSPFVQPAQPAAPTFGQTSQPKPPPFASSGPNPSPFAASAPPNQQPPNGVSLGQPSAFGQPSAPSQGQSQAPPQQAAPAPLLPKAATNGQPPAKTLDAEGHPSQYEGELGAALKLTYEKALQTGSFDDLVPEVPPKREWMGVTT